MSAKLPFVSMVLLLPLLASSCVTRLDSFTAISTNNIEWSRADEFIRYDRRVQGEDTSHTIIVFPTKLDSIDAAVANALDKIPGAVALFDVVVYSKVYFSIPFVYGRSGYMVEGRALVDPKYAAGHIEPVSSLETD
jgi:hypothetical protein